MPAAGTYPAGKHCFTSTEVARLHAALETTAHRHVTVIAGSGDIGPVGEPCVTPPVAGTQRGVLFPGQLTAGRLATQVVMLPVQRL